MQQLVLTTAPSSAADLLSGYGAGALIRVERDTSSSMSGAVEITTVALVSGTERYEYWDTTGTSSHYYRTRFSKAAPSVATDYSSYSAVFQAGQVTTYATLDDVRAALNLGNDTSKDAYLQDLLLSAKELIDHRCGRSFVRNPQVSGDGTFTLQVRFGGERQLSKALGYGIDIISVTTLEIADVDGGTYVTVPSGSTGYYLTDNMGPTTDWPYQELELSRVSSVRTQFPVGETTCRITGVLGFSTVPAVVRRATIDLVREWYRQGPQGGVQAGISPFTGTPMFLQGEPHSFRQLTAVGSRYVKFDYAPI